MIATSDSRGSDHGDGSPAWWCERLGLPPASEFRDLSQGQSGSRVVSVRTGATRAVVKITCDPARLARARREIEVLRELGRRERRVAPELLAAVQTDEGVAIALPECMPLPAPDRITDGEWIGIATALADLHQLIDPQDVPEASRRSGSADHDQEWVALGSAAAAARGRELLRRVPDLVLPIVLQHGDCHVENIVSDHDGRPLWIDWQEARPGDGLGDLVFLWQRAEFAGARPPRTAMTAAYAAGRHRVPAELQPLLDRTELRLLLDAWPPFLGYGDAAAREVMRSRLAALTGAAAG